MGGGCALSIAYNNVGKPTKNDFIVISVNHNCPQLGPFTHSFPMPKNLPDCEACTCAWTWVPDERSSADEMVRIVIYTPRPTPELVGQIY